jgi:hypothetical protein
MDKVLDRDAFAAWLRERGELDVVGETCHAASCPLAHYLQAQGHPQARVREEHYCLDGADEFSILAAREELPTWARRFVRAVDGLSLRSEVYAYQAMAILEQLDDE